MADTIFALSSGAPPAAIAIVRVSGPAAGEASAKLAGSLPAPRRAGLRQLRDCSRVLLDEALVLWFPAPATATGEDLVELHLHGGRAVVRAVERALEELPELRRATPGEFTRRAFANGRIDLAEAEGLADLLAAETELQRRHAVELAGGGLSRTVDGWRQDLLALSAALEAILDFADEDDVADIPSDFATRLEELAGEIGVWLDRPRAELLKEGFTVVLAGPPNVGKSSLFNSLVESEAAITAPLPGTTRDVLTRPVAIGGVPFVLIDTAGLREDAADPIERIGVARASAAAERADLVLWLGPESCGPAGAWEIEPQIDAPGAGRKHDPRYRVSAKTGEGLARLRAGLVEHARSAMPRPGETALNERQWRLLNEARQGLLMARAQQDVLVAAEELRVARGAFDALLGRTSTEDVLDALFGRFCIGK